MVDFHVIAIVEVCIVCHLDGAWQQALALKLSFAHVRDLVGVVSMMLKDAVVAALESQEDIANFLPGVLLIGFVD